MGLQPKTTRSPTRKANFLNIFFWALSPFTRSTGRHCLVHASRVLCKPDTSHSRHILTHTESPSKFHRNTTGNTSSSSFHVFQALESINRTVRDLIQLIAPQTQEKKASHRFSHHPSESLNSPSMRSHPLRPPTESNH